jgi:hypothetical protein
LLVSAISSFLAYGIGRMSVVNSLACIPSLTLRVECGASAALAKTGFIQIEQVNLSGGGG